MGTGEPAQRVGGERQQKYDDEHEERHTGARRPDGALAGHEADAPPPLPLAALALLEVLDGFLDDVRVDAPLAVGVARQQAVVTDDVDDAWRPLAVVGDFLDGGVGEDAGIGKSPTTARGRDRKSTRL